MKIDLISNVAKTIKRFIFQRWNFVSFYQFICGASFDILSLNNVYEVNNILKFSKKKILKDITENFFQCENARKQMTCE